MQVLLNDWQTLKIAPLVDALVNLLDKGSVALGRFLHASAFKA